MKSTFKILASLLAFASSALASTVIPNPIYIISNAEQPSVFRPGLTPIGVKRATECLPALFSTLNIGKIISCPRNNVSEVCFDTLATVQPTADALGLPIDFGCGADENTDDDCVTDLTHKFAKTSSQAILIVWDFHEMGALLGEDLDLDTDDADAVDGIHYDVLTFVVKSKIEAVVSHNCTGIDGIFPGTELVPPVNLTTATTPAGITAPPVNSTAPPTNNTTPPVNSTTTTPTNNTRRSVGEKRHRKRRSKKSKIQL